jgi:chemotaxis protein methyltransferase CheR
MMVGGDVALLAAFSHFLETRMGLHYADERRSELARVVSVMAAELGFPDAGSCMRHFLATEPTRGQIETLASHLTIGETYFFREPLSFQALASIVLPPLIEARRKAGTPYLRIWSAACSTGEEAYSVAMLLDRLVPDIQEWNITILATDINPRSLRRALDGVYGEWSFRGTDTVLRERYFERKDGRYSIIPRIRRMVSFTYHNLAEDLYPSVTSNTNAMDIIFCRNVLMYFSFDRARQVVGNLYNSLVEGGWLVASSVEGSTELFSPFVNAQIPGATFYRKQDGPIKQDAPAPLPLPPSPSPASVSPHSPSVPQATPAPPPSPTALPELLEATQSLYQQGRYREAIGQLMAHQTLIERDGGALTLLARLHANEGRLEEAEHWCRRALAADRLTPERHYLMAMISQELGNAKVAAEALRSTLFLDPGFVLAHFALARLALAEGRVPEARRHYRNTLELLRRYTPEDTLPESDGLTVGRLTEIIRIASAEVGL